jgi:Helix-turn-helix domain of resolvase
MWVKLERRRILERTARGRADAKANGVKFGRKPILTPHQQKEARQRLEAGETQRSVARSYNVSQSTISRLPAASFAATPRMAKMISAESDVVSRNGSASDRIPAPARCMSRAITRRSVVSRERRSTAGVMTTWGRASSSVREAAAGRRSCR